MQYFNKKICIIGTGGFGREALCCLIDSIANSDIKIDEVACFMEKDSNYKEEKIMGVDVIRESHFNPLLYNVFVAIGEPQKRKIVVDQLPVETTYATIIHPSSVISKWVEIGEGSIVTAGSILTCNIKIGKHAHLNLHTTIGHDCIIGDFFTSTPGVNISGNCNIGDCVYIGTNSSVKQGITICNNVTVGMGGVAVKDISEEGIYIGNPLIKFKK